MDRHFIIKELLLLKNDHPILQFLPKIENDYTPVSQP